jgi:beta-fructofuranosidase
MTDGKSRANTSLVPQFHFADTLNEQEAQLDANPLLQRFAESRRRMAADPYRPLYHYVSPESTMNDPNGLCFWQGRWHLFYQGYPPEETRQHWGHTVSDDLIHWRDLPYAIYPVPERCCFSGATLVEDNRVIAMYHGTEAGNMVAVSSDPLLLNWTKLTGRPVIPARKPDGSPQPFSVFDSCIWKRDGLYYSLSGGTQPHEPSGRRRPAEFLLKSCDLVNWEYLHPFVEGDVFSQVGDDGACPYFWPIGDRHILLHFSHMSGARYLLGDYDTQRDKFLVTDGGRFTFGAFCPGGVHAPSATSDSRGSVVVIFNINSAKPTPGWDQIMSLPRRLTLIGKNELGMEPAGNIASLRGEHRHLDETSLPANREVVLDGIAGSAMEIAAEIDPRQSPMIELNVLRSPGKEEFTRIVFFKRRGFQNWDRFAGWDKWFESCDSLITIDNAYSSELPDVTSRAPETAPVWLAPDERLKLRVFIDKSVVEVFVNDRQCLAVRVYPGRTDSRGVSLRSQGQEARLISLDAWQMKGLYA